MTELVSGCTCDACAIKPTRNSLLKAVLFEMCDTANNKDRWWRIEALVDKARVLRGHD